MIAGKTRDNLQPWEPKQDKKCLNFQVFPWGKNNNDEKGKKNNLKLNRWYLDEGDVAQHVACLFLLEYGNGSNHICNQACTQNCQHYLRYQIDILWEEMTGVRENMGTARSGGICDDFVHGWDVDEDGNLKLQKDIDQLFSQFLIFQSYQTFCRIINIRWRNNKWISSNKTHIDQLMIKSH